jgi:hypothetical protein
MNRNEAFEAALMVALENNLKAGTNTEKYYDAVLNEKWDGEGYGDFYYEIRCLHTEGSNPVVVSL